MKLVRVVTGDGEEVEFAVHEVTIRHTPEGVRISPRSIHENTLGFTLLFWPWGEVRQIKEYERV